jgi:type II secretory pathway pseudopilin PulG
MKPRLRDKANAAMTLTEVVVVIAILVLLAAVLLPGLKTTHRALNQSIFCSNNIKQIQLGYRAWANDHGDKFPMEVSVVNGGTKELAATGDAISTFIAMSNELSNPRVLVCWQDKERFPLLYNSVTNFSAGLAGKISYFVGLYASTNHPNALLCGDNNFEISGKPVMPGLLDFSTNSPIAWTSARHHSSGNIGLADGSVQTVNNSNLVVLIQQTGLATNHLAIP